ncbi:MAG TPA: NADH-quinone oxidoreductase subunit M [Candidatus Sulfotelmatobacter sp.]|nr:NADH-quinone oxidoreductase subunit M [Candidatus Sulfotelmatobacter sp.]
MTPWLTLVLLIPLAGAVVLQLLPARASTAIKAITIAATAAPAVIVGGLIVHLDRSLTSAGPLVLQYDERHDWIPAIGASYHIGVDGVSSWFLALNAGLFLVAALFIAGQDLRRLKFFCSLLLITDTATTGVLTAADLLLFYFFWEAMLIPLYLILGNYGGEQRGRATLKFIIYTVAGSLLMLVAIIYEYFQAGRATFDLQALVVNPPLDTQHLGILGITFLSPAQLAFLAFALAFAIKLPLVPFHTWLPDLYESAPPVVLVFFAGLVSKLGAYGLIRYAMTLFPGPVHDFQWLLAALAVLSIIYGAMLALSETDIKRIVAYASISHLGFIALGIFSLNPTGINGAVIQVVNHGIIIVALFLVVGVIESRTGTRDRHELSGLESRMPWLYAFFLIITLAALGLPGMNTFVGEFTIMLGAFQSAWILAVLAGVGVVLACWYMLRLHQGLMHDPPGERTRGVGDLRVREGLVLAPLVALMVFLGVFPRPLGDVTKSSANEYSAVAGGALTAPSSAPPTPAPSP